MSETLSLVDAAELVKMHPATLKALARSGKAPGYKPAGRWIFFRDELVNWIRGGAPRDDARQNDVAKAVRALSIKAERKAPARRDSARLADERYFRLLGLPVKK